MKSDFVVPDQEGTLGKFVPKGRGYEYWIVNTEKYCGKLLFFKSGFRCSWHYHKEKDETFYVHSGELLVTYSFDDCLNESGKKKLKAKRKLDFCSDICWDKTNYNMIRSGESFHVPAGMRHSMKASDGDVIMFEFSTTHYEEDSYRIAKGD